MTAGQDLASRLGLGSRPDLEVRLDEPMSRHTTNRLGGPADAFVRPSTVAALSDLLAAASDEAVPVTFVGSGTNLLVRDGGIRGLTVNLGRLNAIHRPEPDVHPGLVHVEAGASTGRLLKHALEWERGGLEFLGGVPGSVGGGLIMNAGTYLGEFTDVVRSVASLRRDGSSVTRVHAECGFRYRDSDLPPDEIVVSALLDLPPRPRADIEADVAALRKRRHEREPKRVPNNGSTFKNPPGDYAGRLIEAAGLKGTRAGGAIVSPVHANWLVVDKAVEPACTARDLIALIEHVRERVLEHAGILLELEVRIIGED